MSIYVVGSSKNLFLECDDIREKFIVDSHHNNANIDSLNPWYCELTGLYHLWKNSTATYVGLEHYRRFFASPSKTKQRMNKSEVEQILSDHDIITCTYRHVPGYCGYKWFRTDGRIEDLEAFIYILDDFKYDCSEEIRKNSKFKTEKCYSLGEAFREYTMERELVQCNMFIAKKPIINEYCEWLFPKLELFDHYYGLTDTNKRIDGYLSEHIFGLWIRMKGLKNYTATKVEMKFKPVSGSVI